MTSSQSLSCPGLQAENLRLARDGLVRGSYQKRGVPISGEFPCRNASSSSPPELLPAKRLPLIRAM